MIKRLILLCFASLVYVVGHGQTVTSTPVVAAVTATSHAGPNSAIERILSGPRLCRVTAYWAGEGDYYTSRLMSATGVALHEGHCAVDPSIIPYGSVVDVSGIGRFLAVDTGSAVVDRKAARKSAHTTEEKKALVIDLYFKSRKAGKAFAANAPLYASISWSAPSSPSILSSAPVMTRISTLLRLGLVVHLLRLPDEIAPISTLPRLGVSAHPLRLQVEVAAQ